MHVPAGCSTQCVRSRRRCPEQCAVGHPMQEALLSAMVGGSCRIGCNQSESHRLTDGKPFPPVVESLITEAAIPAKDTDRKPALLVLPDQFCPLLLTRRTCLDSSHPSHYRALSSSCARGVHRVLTFAGSSGGAIHGCRASIRTLDGPP